VYEAMLISGSPISESLNAGKNSEINSREIITKRNELTENELQHPRYPFIHM
jgi:hypothetical protein